MGGSRRPLRPGVGEEGGAAAARCRVTGDRDRLRWQCRRGIRELELFLNRFVDSGYHEATVGEQHAFAGLLTLSDPVLLDRITGREPPTSEDERRVIESLRRIPGN